MTTTTTTTTSPISYHITKSILLKSIGLIYWIAFLSAYYQNEGLMGRNGGLMPYPSERYMEHPNGFWASLKENPIAYLANKYQNFQNHPCIFWFGIGLNDTNIHNLILIGLTLSAVLVLFVRDGNTSMFHMFVLWILYFSIVTSSKHTSFYAYGWENQLLETGFLSMMLCTSILFPSSFFNSKQQQQRQQSSQPPSTIILWLFRWLIFRISMGAGLIKVRGDSCWTSKTCLWYHFETQPIPSPTSYIFHFLPRSMLSKAVDLDLFVQVYTSWMVLLPTYDVPYIPSSMSKLCLYIVRLGGMIQIGFMLNIIVSGNLGFLPHMTIVPPLACLDDTVWKWLVTKMDYTMVSNNNNNN